MLIYRELVTNITSNRVFISILGGVLYVWCVIFMDCWHLKLDTDEIMITSSSSVLFSQQKYYFIKEWFEISMRGNMTNRTMWNSAQMNTALDLILYLYFGDIVPLFHTSLNDWNAKISDVKVSTPRVDQKVLKCVHLKLILEHGG